MPGKASEGEKGRYGTLFPRRRLRPLPTAMHLRLLIPELVWSEPGDAATLADLPCPQLERLLARGRLGRQPRAAWESVVAAEFGLAADAPYGALRLLGEGPAGEAARDGWWLCADPVHLRLHQERMVLADAGAVGIDAAEAEALVAALNEHFAAGDIPGCEAGARFVAPAADRWYLRLGAGRPVNAAPLSAVAGRRLETLPAGLVHFVNEAQTLLHAHPANARREAAGQPPINSLWLWGGGTLPHSLRAAVAGVWSDAPLASGLALAAGIPRRPQPAGLAPLLADAAPGTTRLAVIDTLLAPALYEDGDVWRDAMIRLEAAWFAPLAAALARGRLRDAVIVAPTAYGVLEWRLDRKTLWKFWQRPQALADLARRLAESPR